MTETVTDHPDRSRFEMDVRGETVFATYRRQDGRLYVTHVEAPPALRGTGAAGRFMTGLMRAARAEGAKVVPICGYARSWIQAHAEYHDLLA